MKQQLMMLLLGTASVFCSCETQVEQHEKNELRAPAYPLVTIDPYTSAWSTTDNLYDSPVKHWTGKDFSLLGVAKVDGQTYRFMGTEELELRPLVKTSEIQQSVSYPVMTITCNQIFTRFQRGYYFFRQFHPFVLFTSITCIYHFDAVDINNSIIVMREFKIYILSCQILLNISYPAYPDKFFTPLGFGCMFILHGSEGSFAFFPGFIIESG